MHHNNYTVGWIKDQDRVLHRARQVHLPPPLTGRVMLALIVFIVVRVDIKCIVFGLVSRLIFIRLSRVD